MKPRARNRRRTDDVIAPALLHAPGLLDDDVTNVTKIFFIYYLHVGKYEYVVCLKISLHLSTRTIEIASLYL